jgi:hypothetical protein
MKLYRNTTKRIAQKKIGRSWDKLSFGLTLKPGDLVSSCKGFNEFIKVIEPCWTSYGMLRGNYIYDFDIETVGGGSCSLIHCCSFPLENLDEIVEYWMKWDDNSEEAMTWYGGQEKWEKSFTYRVIQALKRGDKVFNDNGTITEEFNPYNKLSCNV